MPDVFTAKTVKKKTKKISPSTLAEKKIKLLKDSKNAPSERRKIAKSRLNQKPLSSFRYFPDKAEFVHKDPEEEVILLLRKHPLTNLRWIIIFVLMLAAPTLIFSFPVFEILPFGFQIVAILGWYLLSVTYAFEKFLGWFYHVNIITDERIFDIDFINLIYREITDANIDQIQDVTVEVGGSLGTVFNYGNVLVQTAAQIPQVEFEEVPTPDRVAKILRELRIEEEIEKLEGRIR